MIRVYGSGDDLIIVEGDITAEFFAEEETHFLAFSDGSLLILTFLDGNWKIRVFSDSEYQAEKASTYDDIASDIIDIDISPDWIVFGNKYERAS
jgi:hypothetical protein